MKKSLAAVILAAALTVGPMGVAPPAHAAFLGWVTKGMIDNFCMNTFGHSYTGSPARPHDPNNAYSWRCPRGQGVDMNRVCHLKYGHPAYSKVNDARNPGGWYCWR